MFIDFFNKDGVDVWEGGLKDLYDLVPYNGLWLDMNEATGFCNGECPDGPPPKNNTNTTMTSTKRNLRVSFLSEEAAKDVPNWFVSYSNQENNSTYDLPFIPQ